MAQTIPVRVPAALQHYRAQQVQGASPMQLVLMVYDIAIVACEARDPQRAGRALSELIGSLNFEYEEIATGLFRLYEYCLWGIRRSRFQDAAKVLRGLRQAWVDAMAAERPANSPRPSASRG